MKYFFASILGLALYSNFASAQFKERCSDRYVQSALASDNSHLNLNCSLFLEKTDVLRKVVTLSGSKASNTLIDCQGGSIEAPIGIKAVIVIKSEQYRNFDYDVPENITIRNCKLVGTMRIYGLGVNGQSEEVKRSSRFDNKHTARAQAAAPRNIVLDNNTHIVANYEGVYVGPGSTNITIQNSRFRGETTATSIYMDAESAYNKILNNSFFATNKGRETIAVDGSAHNIIAGNYFGSLSRGGIYLYRNCGEGGTIRIQTPHSNLIKDNYFYYDKFAGYRRELVWRSKFGISYPSYETIYYPSVYLGSRQGDRNYCDADRGYNYGSSASNLDFADNNTVINNSIRNLSTDLMIRNRGKNNVIRNNKTVR